MKFAELKKAMQDAERAQLVLAELGKTDHIELELLSANDSHLASVDLIDPVFFETVKAHVRDEQTKLLAEASAKLTAHGIDVPVVEPAEEMEDVA